MEYRKLGRTGLSSFQTSSVNNNRTDIYYLHKLVLEVYYTLLFRVRQHALIPLFLKIVSEVKKILYRPKLTFCLVECFNSILRPIQQVKKQVTQEFLWLKALHHNMKSFKQGKRKGKSSFQLLGVDFGTQDWIQLLENYQLAV